MAFLGEVSLGWFGGFKSSYHSYLAFSLACACSRGASSQLLLQHYDCLLVSMIPDRMAVNIILWNHDPPHFKALFYKLF